MLSYIFLAYALVHLGLLAWAWRAWSELGRPVALFIVAFGNTLLWWDNFRIGSGRFLGEGDLLYAMTVPAFAWHWSMLPLLVIAAGSVARLADLPWARNRLVMGAFCLAAVALAAHDIPKIFSMQLYPACLDDTVRYTSSPSEAQLCRPDQVVVKGGAEAALVAIITNIIVLAVGIALWIQRGWKWLALGSGAMFIAAGAFARAKYSLPISNFGEILITASFIATCVHFARLRGPAPAGARGSADARQAA